MDTRRLQIKQKTIFKGKADVLKVVDKATGKKFYTPFMNKPLRLPFRRASDAKNYALRVKHRYINLLKEKEKYEKQTNSSNERG